MAESASTILGKRPRSPSPSTSVGAETSLPEAKRANHGIEGDVAAREQEADDDEEVGPSVAAMNGQDVDEPDDVGPSLGEAMGGKAKKKKKKAGEDLDVSQGLLSNLTFGSASQSGPRSAQHEGDYVI